MTDKAAKKTALENHLREPWRSVHNIWPNIGADSGIMGVVSDQANSTTTMANAAGLSFAVAASKKYHFRFFLHVTTTAQSCALRYQFTGPTSAGTFRFRVIYFDNSPALQHEEVSGLSTSSTATSQSSTFQFVEIEGKFINGTNAGTVRLQFKAEVADETVTIKTGSSGTWHLLS